MSDVTKAALETALTNFANDPAQVAAVKQQILDRKAARKVAKKATTTQAAKAAAAPAPKAVTTKAPAKAPAKAAAPKASGKVLQSASAERFILTDHQGNVLPFKENGKLVWSTVNAKPSPAVSGHPAYAKGGAYLQFHQNTQAAREAAFNTRSKTRLLNMAPGHFRGPVKKADGTLDWSATTFVAKEAAYKAYLLSVKEDRPA